jgi:4-hydroxy-tetrahydrodipicolinate synthase
VTPLLDFETIDETGTRRLLEHILQANVAGIFLLGTTGEFASLSLTLRCDFIRLCCRIVDGRVPVMVGIADCSYSSTVELAHIAKEAGASAVVLTTPFYFPMEQEEVKIYIERVLQSVTLPVVLYNMPGLTKVWLEVETLELLAKHEQIVGLKDSSGDLAYFARVCKLKTIRPDWTIMMGPEHLLAEAVRLGADGGVNGGANVYPELFVQACKAAQSGQKDLCNALMSQIDEFQAIYRVGTPGFRYVTATKYALSHVGICNDIPVVAPPLLAYTEDERRELGQILDSLDRAIKALVEGGPTHHRAIDRLDSIGVEPSDVVRASTEFHANPDGEIK